MPLVVWTCQSWKQTRRLARRLTRSPLEFLDNDTHQQVQVPVHSVQVGPEQLNFRIPKIHCPLGHAPGAANLGDGIFHGPENGLALGHGILGEPDGVFRDEGLYAAVAKARPELRDDALGDLDVLVEPLETLLRASQRGTVIVEGP